ncbi:MAG: glycosyltransferase family 39 protein [Planctomycetes bacterium]|nr:glycosyltransferase family 39 protein [Planctomycetota bacterium]MBU4397951.1 glycosyltransferase family 39 protein [Planctomycetota bacterium]MCG2684222.1 glycosyltransferase family 39 protein [Planctomycetales bacterium]
MSSKLIGPLLIALAALAAVLTTIAPDGNGPGVTCDEPYHVFQGKRLVTALRRQGPAFFLPNNIERNFDWPLDGPPVQAPLGYWILGWTNYLFDPAPDDPLAFSIPAARFAPAAAFALLILMVGTWTSRREGALAGTVAAAAVALTPRLFGHAHFAALDMPTTLFFVAAVLAVAEASRSGKTWHFALAGVVWGAAMLIRLHGLLLAPPVIVWLFWRLRRRVVWPLAAWFAAGAATFFVGWPWLWLDPLGRFQQYLASGADRLSLNVFYWGQIWADRDVPWHYPWVMFAVTVPLGLLLLGMLGLWSECVAGGLARRDTHDTRRASPPATRENFHRNGDCALIAGTMFFLLLVFSWPGVPVYDGVRLFLMVFPLWAVWVGIGARWLVESSSRVGQAQRSPTKAVQNDGGTALRLSHPTQWKSPRAILAAIVALVALQGIGLAIYQPCHLSYYNLLAGGLAGAERLGFEATYWGDSVREPLLAEGARLSGDAPILFAPNLAPFQAPAVAMYSPSLNEAGVELVGEKQFEPELADRCRYAVIYNRRANPASVVGRGKVVSEYRKQGVWLARLVELTAPLDEPSQ